MSYVDRINCWENTKQLSLFLMKNKSISPSQSIKYKFNAFLKPIKEYNLLPCVNIINMDTLDCGYVLKQQGYNPLVLNMADAAFPGGQVDLGSGAQEESLFRRSNYYLTLNLSTKYYPLGEDEAIYSPMVHILKNKNMVNIQNIYSLSLVACPGLREPKLDNMHLKEEDVNILKNKIRLIFQIAYINKHDSMVLGALGCGAWRNPPEDVAKIFKAVIAEYKGIFKHIFFAILDGNDTYTTRNHNQTQTNFKVFQDILT